MNDDRMLQAMDRFIARVESALIKLRYEDVNFVKGYYFERREYPESEFSYAGKGGEGMPKVIKFRYFLMPTLQNIKAYQKEMREYCN